MQKKSDPIEARSNKYFYILLLTPSFEKIVLCCISRYACLVTWRKWRFLRHWDTNDGLKRCSEGEIRWVCPDFQLILYICLPEFLPSVSYGRTLPIKTPQHLVSHIRNRRVICSFLKKVEVQLTTPSLPLAFARTWSGQFPTVEGCVNFLRVRD